MPVFMSGGVVNRGTVQIAETNGDVAVGNSFNNNALTQLWYRNAGATPRTFTITTTKVIGVDNLSVADQVVNVAASSDWVPIGLFDPDIYGTQVVVTPSHSDVRFKVWLPG